MPEQYSAVEEEWASDPCPNCHGLRVIYAGMVCNTCGGFGFINRLVSQRQYINGEWLDIPLGEEYK